MEKFVDFASGMYGRAIRVVVGAVLVYFAIASAEGIWVWVFAIIAALLVASGAFGFCALNLLVGRPITAKPQK